MEIVQETLLANGNTQLIIKNDEEYKVAEIKLAEGETLEDYLAKTSIVKGVGVELDEEGNEVSVEITEEIEDMLAYIYEEKAAKTWVEARQVLYGDVEQFGDVFDQLVTMQAQIDALIAGEEAPASTPVFTDKQKEVKEKIPKPVKK